MKGRGGRGDGDVVVVVVRKSHHKTNAMAYLEKPPIKGILRVVDERRHQLTTLACVCATEAEAVETIHSVARAAHKQV